DRAGGTLRAIEQGLVQRQTQDAAHEAQQAVDAGRTQRGGLHDYATDDQAPSPLLQRDASAAARQAARVASGRAARGADAWRTAPGAVAAAAGGDANLVPPIIAAVEARATLGEIADTLRGVFGEHRELLV